MVAVLCGSFPIGDSCPGSSYPGGRGVLVRVVVVLCGSFPIGDSCPGSSYPGGGGYLSGW